MGKVEVWGIDLEIVHRSGCPISRATSEGVLLLSVWNVGSILRMTAIAGPDTLTGVESINKISEVLTSSHGDNGGIGKCNQSKGERLATIVVGPKTIEGVVQANTSPYPVVLGSSRGENAGCALAIYTQHGISIALAKLEIRQTLNVFKPQDHEVFLHQPTFRVFLLSIQLIMPGKSPKVPDIAQFPQ
jgi:hypothetical protein